MGWWKGHSINEWIFSKTEIFRSKCESWIRLMQKKTDLANLKSDVDKSYIDKSKNLLSG